MFWGLPRGSYLNPSSKSKELLAVEAAQPRPGAISAPGVLILSFNEYAPHISRNPREAVDF